VEEPQNDDVGIRHLVAEDVSIKAILANFSSIEHGKAGPAPGELDQALWSLLQSVLDFIGKRGIMDSHEIYQAIDIVPCLRGPSYSHATRAVWERAFRLAAKCFSISSWEKEFPSSTDFIASNVSS